MKLWCIIICILWNVSIILNFSAVNLYLNKPTIILKWLIKLIPDWKHQDGHHSLPELLVSGIQFVFLPKPILQLHFVFHLNPEPKKHPINKYHNMCITETKTLLCNSMMQVLPWNYHNYLLIWDLRFPQQQVCLLGCCAIVL